MVGEIYYNPKTNKIIEVINTFLTFSHPYVAYSESFVKAEFDGELLVFPVRKGFGIDIKTFRENYVLLGKLWEQKRNLL